MLNFNVGFVGLLLRFINMLIFGLRGLVFVMRRNFFVVGDIMRGFNNIVLGFVGDIVWEGGFVLVVCVVDIVWGCGDWFCWVWFGLFFFGVGLCVGVGVFVFWKIGFLVFFCCCCIFFEMKLFKFVFLECLCVLVGGWGEVVEVFLKRFLFGGLVMFWVCLKGFFGCELLSDDMFMSGIFSCWLIFINV